ncbi:MAG: metallophosphoesterase [Candidatus Aminicenantales bacterium]
MGFPMASPFDRALRRNKVRLPLGPRSRVVIFSDLHRGIGDEADDFRHNQLLFEAALEYYNRRRFTYIELGDGDELVENTRFEAIVRSYGRIFRLLDRFQRDGRLYYLVGNHNLQMGKARWREKHLAKARRIIPGLWEALAAPQTILLGDKIFLLHGHQADVLSTFVAPLSRFFMRTIWRFLKNVFGFKNPLSVSQNPRKRSRVEQRILGWAARRRMVAVAGHTHRPVFMSLGRQESEAGLAGRPYYFNCGSGVHPGAVTALEIETMTIRLVNWRIRTDPRHRGRLRAARQTMEGCQRRLRDIYAQLQA